MRSAMPLVLALLPLAASQFLARQDEYDQLQKLQEEVQELMPLTEQQDELQKLKEEVKQWKARYGDLLHLYSEVSQQPLIEARPYEEKIFMPGNVQHCRDEIASLSPKQGTNPRSETNMDFPNYSYVVYSPESLYASHLKATFDSAESSLKKLKSLDVKNPAIMFDIDNTLAYTGFNDTDILGKAPPMTEAVDFAKRWCRFEETSSKPFECFFMTARYCTNLKAVATKTWVKETFSVDEKWMADHVFMTGAIGGCQSNGCSLAYKAVLRNWLHSKKNIHWVMSVGDQLTDSAGVHSGLRVKVPNFWFDSSIVANPQENGGKIHLGPDRTFAGAGDDGDDKCHLKCVAAPEQACLEAGMKDDAVYKFSQLEYCMAQTKVDQIRGCTVNLFTHEVVC